MYHAHFVCVHLYVSLLLQKEHDRRTLKNSRTIVLFFQDFFITCVIFETLQRIAKNCKRIAKELRRSAKNSSVFL